MTGAEFKAALARLGLPPYGKQTARILGAEERTVARWAKYGPPVLVQTVLRLIAALLAQGWTLSDLDPGPPERRPVKTLIPDQVKPDQVKP